MTKFVAYYRVSTNRQGESGLGLEAQQESVQQYVKAHGHLAEEFHEVETGKRFGKYADTCTCCEMCERGRACNSLSF